MLINGVIRIIEGCRQRIIKHGNGFVKRNPVLSHISFLFFPVLFELHNGFSHLFCIVGLLESHQACIVCGQHA